MMNNLACVIIVLASMFTHLGVQDGLTQATVFSISEDSRHNVWFSTQSGISVFDGYDLRTYKHNPEDSTSVGNNRISLMLPGSDGHVFVCYRKGVDLFSPDSDSFRRLLSGSVFHSACLRDDGCVVVSYGTSLYTFRPDGTAVEETDISPFYFKLMSFCDGRLWGIDNEERLTVMEPGGLSLKRITGTPKVRYPFSCLWRKGELWISSDSEGLYRFDGEGHLLRHYTREDGLCSNYVRPLCEDGSGNIWIGTGNNLSILDCEAETFTTVSPDRNRKESLSHASIKSLLKDSFGGIWIGTYYAGADYYHPARNRFESFNVTNDRTEDIIGAMSELPDGKLLIGTSRKGVFTYDIKTSKAVGIPALSISSEVDAEKYDIKAIEYSKNGRIIYFGTGLGGLLIYDRVSGQVRRLSDTDYPVSVYSIVRLDDSHILLGTENSVRCYWETTGEISYVYPEVRNETNLMNLLKASDSTFWIGTFYNLLHIRIGMSTSGKPDVDVISSFKINSRATDIFESSDGKVFVCTSTTGVLCPDEQSGKLRRLDLGPDYSGALICGIVEDDFHRLWISSESGLYCYNQENGFISHYSVEDGLPSNVFVASSNLKCSNGKVYLGTVGKVVSFDPSSIVEHGVSPNPTIKSVEVDGADLLPYGSSSITLAHSQNNFRITYSVCNPISWKNSSFRYRMEGFDQKWREVSGKREAEYSNLPAGRYVFRLQSANDEGKWCEGEAVLKIRVRPVWYFSTLAVIIEILSVIFALTVLFRALLKRAGKKDKKEIEKLRKKVHENERRSLANAFGKRNLSDEDYEFLKKAVAIAMENIGNVQFNVNDFADKMGISRSGLHGHIKEITGESALVFIKKIRFDYACQLLRENELSVSDISVKAGFASIAYFTTAFKAFMGQTPKEYQKSTKNI